MLDDILGASHHHGGDAIGFEVACDERGGLVTDRAVRHQHGDINIVSAAARENFGGIDVDGNAMAAVGRRAEEAGRHLADPSHGLRLDELRQRKPGAAVGRGGVLTVIADVGDAKIMRERRVAVIDFVELGTAVISGAGALIAFRRIVGRSCRDNGHARSRQRFCQRLERRVRIVRPAVWRGVADRGVIIPRPLHIGNRRVIIGGEAEFVVLRDGHASLRAALACRSA